MKITDKLMKVDESFTVYMYDNGFMVEVGGRNHDDDWATAKILCNDINEVLEIVKTVPTLPRS